MNKKLFRLMAVGAASILCVNANAYEKVQKSAQLTGEITTAEGLISTEKFYLQDENGKLIHTHGAGNYWDMVVSDLATVSAKDAAACGARFTLAAVEQSYTMQVFHVNGSEYTYWSGNGYVNAQPEGGNVIFALSGAAPQYGQDGQDLALWVPAYEAGKGFSFKNSGRNIYLGSDATAARPSETAKYWKAYATLATSWDSEALLTLKEALLQEIKLNKNIADLKTAEGDDALAAAINEAIDALNELKALHKRAQELDEYGQTVATVIYVNYNDNAYDTIEDVRAAFVEAVKAQKTPGTDMTEVIVNPSFENDFNGWTNNGFATQTNNSFPGKEGNKYAEKWTAAPNCLPNMDITQTITGLSNGTYKVTATMQYLEQGNADAPAKGMFITANDKQTEVTEKAAPVSVKAVVTDGNLTIGAKIENGTGNWCAFDNFKLEYVSTSTVLFPVMSFMYDEESHLLTFSPSDKEVYYYPAAAPVFVFEEENINIDTYVAEMVLADYTAADWAELTEPENGLLVKGDYSYDLSEFIPMMGGGEWFAFANFVTPELAVSETERFNFYINETSEFAIAEMELTAEGGYITFSENVGFKSYEEEETCDVKKDGEVVAKATLTYDDDDFAKIIVAFEPVLEAGTYTLEIAGLIEATQTGAVYNEAIEFTVEDSAISTLTVTGKKNGKFFQNGKLIIVKNGKSFNAAGM